MTRSAASTRPLVYQLVVRLFGNTNERRKTDGTLEENGAGKFADVSDVALASLRALGVTHVWLTGVLRQATLTDWSSLGLPPDPACVVKGRAGSFYAIRDYFDACPDYAVDPARRREELDALIARVHAAGMKVLIDLVPNHVARGYGSVVEPLLDFGVGDDQTKFFSTENDFFYLVEPKDQALTLERPAGWSPEGVSFDRTFARESGGPGRVPRATGNNVTSPSPSQHDWYETVKLNYGLDFVTGHRVFDPEPKTWRKIDAILAHWQARGVDGFRCDFAHYVPREAWRHLLARVKERDAGAFVMGEAYEDHGALFESGFDALYDFETYNLVKSIYVGRASPRDLEARLAAMGDEDRLRYVAYLENHDERRIPSPIDASGPIGESGFGSADAARQLAPLLFLHGHGPSMILNGQEVGERGEGREGFGGEDGRTTIFDYWSMPALSRWVNGHAYDGGRLSADEQALRRFYGDLLALAADPLLAEAGRAFLVHDRPGEVLAYARFGARSPGRLLVVATSFAMGHGVEATIELDPDVLARGGFAGPDDLEARVVFDRDGAADRPIALDATGDRARRRMVVSIANQASTVIHLARRARASSGDPVDRWTLRGS